MADQFDDTFDIPEQPNPRSPDYRRAKESALALSRLARRVRRLETLDRSTAALLIAASDWGGIIVLHISGAHFDAFPATTGGMFSAITVSAYGDTIWMPPCWINGDFTIPNGVGVQSMGHQSTIDGVITLGNDAHLADMDINHHENSVSQVSGVIAPATGGAHLLDSSVQAKNYGTGTAVAVQDAGTGTMEMRGNYLLGETFGGGAAYAYQLTNGGLFMAHHTEAVGRGNGATAYAGRVICGQLKIWGGRAVGDTGRFILGS